SRADDGNPTPALRQGRPRDYPAFGVGPLDDRQLYVFDHDRVVVDLERAGRLARRRAGVTRELGEVVGGVKPRDRVLPTPLVHEIVPLGDQIAERAAAMTKGDTALHAA